MKPKMLITGDFGWAASSPLIYTLQRNAKYAHFGYTKSFEYLDLKRNRDSQHYSILRLYPRVVSGTYENWERHKQGTHHMNLTEDLEPIKDFPIEYFTKLVSGTPTVSKYMDFYHALHDHVVSKGYKSVGDGHSCIPYKKQSSIRSEFFDTLTSEFDVKQLLIVRDPIRRAWGQYLSQTMRWNYERGEHSLLPSINVSTYLDRIFESYKILGKENSHVIVMEELWEDDGTSKQQLSNFLDHPIPKLWKNLYAPDHGHLVEYDPDVPCQAYGQNLQVLTAHLYYTLKSKYQHIYDAWEDHFGSLPLYWGQHLDYTTGKPV